MAKKKGRTTNYTLWQLIIILVAGFFLAWYGRVMIHEFGHAVTALLMGAESVSIHIDLAWGLTIIWTDGSLASWQLIVIFIAGSLSTLLVGLLFLYLNLSGVWGQFFNIMAIIYVASSISDMIPTLSGSDGWYLADIWGSGMQWGVFGVFCLIAAFVLLKTVVSKDNRLRLGI